MNIKKIQFILILLTFLLVSSQTILIFVRYISPSTVYTSTSSTDGTRWKNIEFTGDKDVDFLAVVNDFLINQYNTATAEYSDGLLKIDIKEKLTKEELAYIKANVHQSYVMTGLDSEVGKLKLQIIHSGKQIEFEFTANP